MKKIVVTSLPKTGTSTLAVMLRILNYKVTGPNPDFKTRKSSLISEYQGFQDYPWCFEYYQFPSKETLFIYLERDDHKWVNSFISQYGNGNNGNYLLKNIWDDIENIPQNRIKLIQKKKEHKELFINWAKKNNAQTLFINIKDISWDVLCDFTDKEIPKNIFGKTIDIPKVNSSTSRKYSKKKKVIRKYLELFMSPEKISDLRNSFFRFLGFRI